MPLSLDQLDRLTAYHEAGHAVAFHHYIRELVLKYEGATAAEHFSPDARTIKLTLDPELDGMLKGRVGYFQIRLHDAERLFRPHFRDELTPDERGQLALCLLAGEWAERVFCLKAGMTYRPGNGSDERQARYWLNPQPMEPVLRAAESFVVRHWEPVDRIARRLLVRRTLFWAEVEQVLEASTT